ncbi:MAG: hypothetical protein U0325_30510 [Polyangiales bacterium]
MQGDVALQAQTDDDRADAAFQLRETRDGTPVGACVDPDSRRGNSVWQRFQGLTPGQRYWVQAVTGTVDRSLGVAYRVERPDAPPRDVTGNDQAARPRR